jgi:hypothetical protein
MTYREGGKVKTRNKYLGPANGGFGSGAPANLPIATQPEKPAGGLKIDKIKRLKPRRRWASSDRTALKQLRQVATDNERRLREINNGFLSRFFNRYEREGRMSEKQLHQARYYLRTSRKLRIRK